jgi:hypothetical protein
LKSRLTIAVNSFYDIVSAIHHRLVVAAGYADTRVAGRTGLVSSGAGLIYSAVGVTLRLYGYMPDELRAT